ncbi:short-chain alcohol dehydrogenase [Scheffersomyces coipomensis]|uniref:short-chain alcohol dehydrogenase n=1 Tax=Scheffersomyces coipomensis TaxID=1788519 RepID=UPI00315CEB0F
MSDKFETPSMGYAGFCALLNGFFPGSPSYTEKDYPKLDGKVVIVTGASAGLGYEVTKSLLGSTNAKVYMFTRNKQKTIDAIKRLETEVAKEFNKTNLNVDYISIDFADLTTIKPAAEEFLSKSDRLDIIIHNAGVMLPPEGSVTKQGFELQLGTNNFGPHLFQKFLDPLIIKTSIKNKPGVSRIVWVSSFGHYMSSLGGIFYPDPNFTTTKVGKGNIYGQSKAINILQAKGWNTIHPDGNNVTCVSLCPGFLRTELQRYGSSFELFMSDLLFKKARYGAYTQLYAALSPEIYTGAHVQAFGKLTTSRPDLTEPSYISKAWKFLDEHVESYL